MTKINICLEFTPECFPNNVFLIWYCDKWIDLPVNIRQTIQEICTVWCHLGHTYLFLCKWTLISTFFFFFALSDVCYINACTLEETNSHLCRISTYSAPTYSIHLITTGTAPRGTYNTPVSKQETFLGPHNSRTIISLDPRPYYPASPQMALQHPGSPTPLVASSFTCSLVSASYILHAGIYQRLLLVSLFSLYTLFFDNFNQEFWQWGLERKMEWELEQFQKKYF